MAVSQGSIDHPSYLARVQTFAGLTTAGNGTVTNLMVPTNNQRLRNVSMMVRTAGTASGVGLQILCIGTCTQFGTTGVATTGTTTTTLGSIAMGTASTAGSIGTSGDLNATVNAGSIIAAKNVGDATFTAAVTIENHVDPLGTWLTSGAGG